MRNDGDRDKQSRVVALEILKEAEGKTVTGDTPTAEVGKRMLDGLAQTKVGKKSTLQEDRREKATEGTL